VAVVVDAKSSEGVAFYKHYGFEELRDKPTSLFISVQTILKAME
jgi:hypothetical protein